MKATTGKLAVALFCGLIVSSAQADNEKLKLCGDISNNDSRLSCYDDLLRDKTKSLNSRSTGGSGRWHVAESTSALTDQKTVVVYLKSNDEANCRFNNKSSVNLFI